MKVGENALKGQYGEAYVASLLSSECLVRQTTSLDVGIDLYCETVKEDQAFLHFWCQVKTGGEGKSRLRIAPDKHQASYRFERKHLEYWDRQAIPVFAAIVPTTWPVKTDPDVYIINVTSQRLSSRRRVTLTSNYKWPAGDREAVRDFLESVVPETTAHLLVRRGVIGSIPKLSPTYSVQVPEALDVLQFQKTIRKQVRRTAAWSVIYLYRAGDLSKADPFFIKRIRQVLEGMTSGWDSCYARGLLSHQDLDLAEATKWYNKSLRIVKKDERFREEIGPERVSRIVTLVQEAREAATNGKPLPSLTCAK